MKYSQFFVFFILALLNIILVYLFSLRITFQQVFTIHIFLFLLFFLTELIKNRILKHNTLPIYSLLSINFLRILACVFFLLPLILSAEKQIKSYIFNFFICYFFYLFNVFFLTRKNLNK